MSAMRYEMFLRSGFALGLECPIDRSGDPAHLADTAIYDLNDVARMRSGIAYVIEIYRSYLENHGANFDPDILMVFASRVHEAQNRTELIQILDEFNQNIVQIHFEFRNGIPHLR